jgi:hypothetical protein
MVKAALMLLPDEWKGPPVPEETLHQLRSIGGPYQRARILVWLLAVDHFNLRERRCRSFSLHIPTTLCSSLEELSHYAKNNDTGGGYRTCEFSSLIVVLVQLWASLIPHSTHRKNELRA